MSKLTSACIHFSSYSELQQLFAGLCFAHRGFSYPGNVFEDCDAAYPWEELMAFLYQLYGKEINFDCEPTYQGHIFFEHAHESRARTGPNFTTDTALFEGMYSILEESYKSGTRNQGKQAMETLLMSTLHKHRCIGDKKLRFAQYFFVF
jgi:hypothetical protein